MHEDQCLKLELEFDADATGELKAYASSNGFSGVGSACFAISEIKEFGLKLKDYPLKEDETYKIEGGYWSGDKKNKIEQIHLYISVYPIGHVGVLGIRVLLSTPILEGHRKEDHYSTVLEIKTLYNSLEKFADEIIELTEGKIDQATLK